MQKVFRYLFLSVLVVFLTGCSFTKKASENGVSGNNDVDVKIKGGTYVLPNDESSDSKYLALNVEIKNKSDKKLRLSEGDITLYNSDDEKIKPLNVYDSNDKFKTMSFEQVSKNKSISGYVVFEVDPKEKYELHYSPLYTDIDAKEKEDVTIKVDAAKYPDNVEKIEELAKQYVDQVFLNGADSANAGNVSNNNPNSASLTPLADKKDDKKKNKDADKGDEFVLGGDLAKAKSDFTKAFTTEFGEEFTYYKPSEAELRTFVDAYAKANAKRAKISYQVKSFFPESAIVYVRPETIGLENIRTYDLISKFADEHKADYSNYNDAYSAAEKYILEQAPSQFDSIPLVTSKYMENEGYELKLVKKNGKWVVDTSDSIGYKSLVRAFSGNSY
jgi:possible lipoprotein